MAPGLEEEEAGALPAEDLMDPLLEELPPARRARLPGRSASLVLSLTMMEEIPLSVAVALPISSNKRRTAVLDSFILR